MPCLPLNRGAKEGRPARLRGEDRGRSPSPPEGFLGGNMLSQPSRESLPAGKRTTAPGKQRGPNSHHGGTPQHHGLGRGSPLQWIQKPTPFSRDALAERG